MGGQVFPRDLPTPLVYLDTFWKDLSDLVWFPTKGSDVPFCSRKSCLVCFCSVWMVSLNPSFYFQHCEASRFIFVSLVVLWLRKQYSKICGFGLKAESTWRGVNTKKAFFIQLKRSTEKDTPSQFFWLTFINQNRVKSFHRERHRIRPLI